MSDSGTVLKASNLSAGWDNRPVVEKVDLSIEAGKILVLAGPNGVGKSTIIKTLVRQIKPLDGKILIEGSDIWQLQPRQFARKVAYVPQFLDIGHDLTVRELVMLGRNPHQPWWSWQASQEDLEQVENSLRRTETWDLRHHYLSNLSGGEKQRALIAVALAQAPSLMLMDEPTAHLDFRHQLELVDLMKRLKEDGIGLAVVLHDLNLMARIADTITFLKAGDSGPAVIAKAGPPAAVLNPQTLRSVYDVEISIISGQGLTTYIPTQCSK